MGVIGRGIPLSICQLLGANAGTSVKLKQEAVWPSSPPSERPPNMSAASCAPEAPVFPLAWAKPPADVLAGPASSSNRSATELAEGCAAASPPSSSPALENGDAQPPASLNMSAIALPLGINLEFLTVSARASSSTGLSCLRAGPFPSLPAPTPQAAAVLNDVTSSDWRTAHP